MDTNTKTLFRTISLLPSYARTHIHTLQKGKKKYHPARMILTVLGINLIPLIVLLFGFALIGDHKENLINAELELLHTRTKLYVNILEHALINDKDPTSITQEGWRALKIDSQDEIIFATSEEGILLNDGHIPKTGETSPVHPVRKLINNFVSSLMSLRKITYNISPYPVVQLDQVDTIPGVGDSLSGSTIIGAWSVDQNELVFSSAAPVFREDRIVGALSVTYLPEQLTKTLAQFQDTIFRIFVSILTLSMAFSLYIVGTITQPLRKLAKAAESIRSETHNNVHEIPDMSNRGDEIGELSIALNAMVEALWGRMETIESFASDVSHELKNPITSLKSALETLHKVKDKEDKAKLLTILEHDVNRLDRLVSDISKSTRLDVELSKSTMDSLDLCVLIADLQTLYQTHYDHKKINNKILIEDHTSGSLFVRGYKDRLVQVLTNIIDNALSFSPQEENIFIDLRETPDCALISIHNKGDGIPENNLDKIFNRFYSDRPKKHGEDYHSGLGLSIVEQIVTAHNGTISARNQTDETGAIIGTVFDITLPIKKDL